MIRTIIVVFIKDLDDLYNTVFISTDRIIAAEVKQILHDNHGISVSDCSSKCDALFDLVAGHDEGLTDRECQAACDQ